MSHPHRLGIVVVGKIATGKSTAQKFLESLEYSCIDSDVYVRRKFGKQLEELSREHKVIFDNPKFSDFEKVVLVSLEQERYDFLFLPPTKSVAQFVKGKTVWIIVRDDHEEACFVRDSRDRMVTEAILARQDLSLFNGIVITNNGNKEQLYNELNTNLQPFRNHRQPS